MGLRSLYLLVCNLNAMSLCALAQHPDEPFLLACHALDLAWTELKKGLHRQYS